METLLDLMHRLLQEVFNLNCKLFTSRRTYNRLKVDCSLLIFVNTSSSKCVYSVMHLAIQALSLVCLQACHLAQFPLISAAGNRA